MGFPRRTACGDCIHRATRWRPHILQRRLDTYPLNDFLRQYAKAGGKVLFILDGVPIWASSNKSTKTFPDPDQKIFRMSPPADFEEWSKVVETIVRHFNGKLGLNAYYESWNEPNWYYLGTTEQYHKQYYHSVLGARRADPRALVGGPGISEFIGTGTRGDGQAPEAEKRAQLQRFVEQQYAFKQFLDYAGRTPVPELGLSRVPVDFFSWHSFYIDPTVYYRVVVPVIRSALTAAGYPATTPLINTEWNIAAVPPYPEGPLNATEVGAAFVASSLIAMHRSGVDAQIFQMYTDPGVDGYFGGTLTQTGIPRANPLLLKAKGKCTTDHISPAGKWLRFRGHLDRISDNMFLGAVNAFLGEAGKTRNLESGQTDAIPAVARAYKAKGLRWIVVGDENYGEGSSREHAALSPRWLGAAAVIVRSFARIHESNLKKQGILPLTFADPADYERVREPDRISVLGLAKLAPGADLEAVLHHDDGTEERIRLRHTLNAEQVGWFRAGSALNVIRGSSATT